MKPCSYYMTECGGSEGELLVGSDDEFFSFGSDETIGNPSPDSVWPCYESFSNVDKSKIEEAMKINVGLLVDLGGGGGSKESLLSKPKQSGDESFSRVSEDKISESEGGVLLLEDNHSDYGSLRSGDKPAESEREEEIETIGGNDCCDFCIIC